MWPERRSERYVADLCMMEIHRVLTDMADPIRCANGEDGDWEDEGNTNPFMTRSQRRARQVSQGIFFSYVALMRDLETSCSSLRYF
jgi:hypothetical protein